MESEAGDADEEWDPRYPKEEGFVQVRCGNRIFYIHEPFIKKYSPVMSTALTLPWKAATTRILELRQREQGENYLDGDDPRYVERMLEWFGHQQYATKLNLWRPPIMDHTPNSRSNGQHLTRDPFVQDPSLGQLYFTSEVTPDIKVLRLEDSDAETPVYCECTHMWEAAVEARVEVCHHNTRLGQVAPKHSHIDKFRNAALNNSEDLVTHACMCIIADKYMVLGPTAQSKGLKNVALDLFKFQVRLPFFEDIIPDMVQLIEAHTMPDDPMRSLMLDPLLREGTNRRLRLGVSTDLDLEIYDLLSERLY